jgi:hypothetical protein
MALQLQDVLNRASYLLGESGTPSSELTKRTDFANAAKSGLRHERNWSWELADGDAINFVYSSSPTNGVYTYTLNPSAGTFKHVNAMYYLKFTDNSGTVTYFKPVSEGQMNYQTANGLTDNVFFVKGNESAGYTLVINAGATALPTTNVTGGFTYRYYCREADFVNLTDSSFVPKISVLAWKVVEMVLYGYREQAQMQLAQQNYQSALAEMAEEDQKHQPFQDQKILSFRESVGFSTNMKTYFQFAIAFLVSLVFHLHK